MFTDEYFEKSRRRNLELHIEKMERIKKMIIALWEKNQFSLDHIKEAFQVEIIFPHPWLSAQTLHEWVVTGNFFVKEVD